ncbi:MAG TPA: PorV/PorQ family protein [Rhodothermales bacterium]|nr:PorV/PorQ family protein [Rhodothermales bacterium]
MRRLNQHCTDSAGRSLKSRIKDCILMTGVLVMLVIGSASTPALSQGSSSGDGFSKGGRAALQFLKIGIGARQAALGEASVASVRDANAIFWNPAGLSAVTSAEASFSYVSWIADLNYVAGAGAIRVGGVGVIGLALASLDYGDIEEALVVSSTGSNDTRTGNVVSGDDFLVVASVAREFTDRLTIGMSAKMVHESLFEYSETIFVFDVGTNYDMRYNGLRLAMSAQNFGTDVRFLEENTTGDGFDIPLMFRIGLSGDLINPSNAFMSMGGTHRLTASVEALSTNDFSERFHVGAEYWFGEVVALRGGYRFNYDEGNLSTGFGLQSRLSDVGVRFDYAYVDYEFLDSPHRFSLSVEL